ARHPACEWIALKFWTVDGVKDSTKDGVGCGERGGTIAAGGEKGIDDSLGEHLRRMRQTGFIEKPTRRRLSKGVAQPACRLGETSGKFLGCCRWHGLLLGRAHLFSGGSQNPLTLPSPPGQG